MQILQFTIIMKLYFFRTGRNSCPPHFRHRAFPVKIFKDSSFILCLHPLHTNAFLYNLFCAAGILIAISKNPRIFDQQRLCHYII